MISETRLSHELNRRVGNLPPQEGRARHSLGRTTMPQTYKQGPETLSELVRVAALRKKCQLMEAALEIKSSPGNNQRANL